MQFMILANPRSRTRWLSEYLECGHDLVLGCRSVNDFADKLRDVRGTVETSVAVGWPIWRDLFPKARFAIIHRAPYSVGDSFLRLGFAPDWMFIYQQDIALWTLNGVEHCLLVSFERLNWIESRETLCDWLGVSFNHRRDERFANEWIEVDAKKRKAQVEANRENFTAFNGDLARRLIAHEYRPQ